MVKAWTTTTIISVVHGKGVEFRRQISFSFCPIRFRHELALFLYALRTSTVRTVVVPGTVQYNTVYSTVQYSNLHSLELLYCITVQYHGLLKLVLVVHDSIVHDTVRTVRTVLFDRQK